MHRRGSVSNIKELSVSPISASRESIEKDAASTWFLIVVRKKFSRRTAEGGRVLKTGNAPPPMIQFLLRKGQDPSEAFWLSLSFVCGRLSYSLQLQSIIRVSATQLEWKQKLFSPDTFAQRQQWNPRGIE